MNAAPTSQNRCVHQPIKRPPSSEACDRLKESGLLVVGTMGTLSNNAHSATDGRAGLCYLFYHATASSSIGSIGSSSSSSRRGRRRSHPVCVCMCLCGCFISSHPSCHPPSRHQQAAGSEPTQPQATYNGIDNATIGSRAHRHHCSHVSDVSINTYTTSTLLEKKNNSQST